LPPRYCPSIDLKYKKFPQRDEHVIWLEPESQYSDSLNKIIFPNGLSTAFALPIQQKIVNSMIGLEDCEILRPSYVV
jgi:tRNA uridine 5-carboxymethylaminomethyl modification enzyme